MLAAGLTIVATLWALWLTYLIRYPRQWSNQVDRIHTRLQPYGLSFPWMAKAEKGFVLKLIVGATTVAMLLCLLLVLRHPLALSTFLHAHHFAGWSGAPGGESPPLLVPSDDGDVAASLVLRI